MSNVLIFLGTWCDVTFFPLKHMLGEHEVYITRLPIFPSGHGLYDHQPYTDRW